MTKNVLVTGASGFVGKILCRKLLDLNYKVSAIDLVDPNIFGVEYINLDLNQDFISFNAGSFDTVVHLAALSTDSSCAADPVAAVRVNLLGTTKLVQAAEQNRAKHFIFASSEWVYPEITSSTDQTESDHLSAYNLKSLYAITKLTAESVIRSISTIPYTVLRFGIVYGPRQLPGSAPESLLLKVYNDEEIIVGSLTTARRFIHVQDLVDGIIKTIKNPIVVRDQVLNLSGTELVSLLNVIGVSESIIGRKANYSESGGTTSIRNPVNHKIIDILSFVPKISLEEGLRDCLTEMIFEK